jgi:hypothetical protein
VTETAEKIRSLCRRKFHRRYKVLTQKVGTHRAGFGAWLVEANRRFDMPMRGELPTITTRTYTRASPVRMAWSRFVAVVSNPELQTVVAFSVIGLLLMLNAIFRFPDFGQTFTEFAFP